MNRIYFTSMDGHVFHIDASSNYYQQLEASDKIAEQESQIKVKYLSSSDWCLWCISNDFKIYIYVFKLATPHEFHEVTYENQVNSLLDSYCKYYDFVPLPFHYRPVTILRSS